MEVPDLDSIPNESGVYEVGPNNGRGRVVFVHGYGSMGAHKDLRKFIERLDQKKYQPVVYKYDHRDRLKKSAEGLSEAIRGFDGPVHVTAHSMGGLVARGAVEALRGEGRVKSLTTIATPFNGHKGAVFGVYLNPIQVGSWKDMVPGSDYQRSFKPLQGETRHNVILANKNGDGDGTISIKSQSKRKIINDADSVREYPESHTGVLENPQVIEDWIRKLEQDDGSQKAQVANRQDPRKDQGISAYQSAE